MYIERKGKRKKFKKIHLPEPLNKHMANLIQIVLIFFAFYPKIDRQIDRQLVRQIDGQLVRQIDGWMDRQID